MIALAIETATVATAIALLDGDDVVVRVLDTSRRHVEALGPGVAALLGDAGRTARDLDVVVVDVGPGLFTGLRVGCALGNALCLATGARAVAVRSTDVLAAAALSTGLDEVVAVVDARRGEVFCARHRGLPGSPPTEGPSVLPPDVLAASLKPGDTVAGDGAERYAARFEAAGASVLRGLGVPPPDVAVRVGATLGPQGPTDAQPDGPLRPLYLRQADATANFQVREAR